MFVFWIVAALAAQALSFWVLYRLWKRLREPGPPSASGSDHWTIDHGKVRALATFTGLRGLPWLALASNSLNPAFHLEAQGLTFRVIRLRKRSYGDIAQVDVREAHGTFNLIFAFRDTRLTFVANVGTAARGAQALALLPPHVPLSARARSVLLRAPLA